MRKITALLAGIAGLTAAGTAVAATAPDHVLKVALPDGSVQQIRYTGDIAPSVIVLPVRAVPALPVAMFDMAPFADLDRIAAEMDRQADAMLRQAAMMATAPADASGKIDRAAFGNMPAGTVHYSFVSTSTGSGTCSRSVQVTSFGAGQQPKVVSRSAGDCTGDKVVPAAGKAPAGRAPVSQAKLDARKPVAAPTGPTI